MKIIILLILVLLALESFGTDDKQGTTPVRSYNIRNLSGHSVNARDYFRKKPNSKSDKDKPKR